MTDAPSRRAKRPTRSEAPLTRAPNAPPRPLTAKTPLGTLTPTATRALEASAKTTAAPPTATRGAASAPTRESARPTIVAPDETALLLQRERRKIALRRRPRNGHRTPSARSLARNPHRTVTAARRAIRATLVDP